MVPLENYLWIKQMIFNDTIDKNSYFPQNVNYQTKIDTVLEKMKGLFYDTDIYPFFIVTDNEQTPYVLYDKEYILQNLEDEYHSNSEVIMRARNVNKGNLTSMERTEFDELKFSEIFKFLYGMSDMQDIAVETIKEYEKEGKIWKDCYDNRNHPKIEFLSANKYLLLIRLSNLGDNQHFTTSGMLGFYGQQLLCDKTGNILPKQLLMLLRCDMNEFIEKHHKNDEFAKLREEEIRNRYAYLAGHGRKMLQDLIEDSDCRELFADIVGTINKLQYVFSTETLKDNRIKILKEGFPYEENTDISDVIEKMAAKIYETSIIENEVELKKAITIEDKSKDILNKFHFNNKLFKFIIFELLVNAKKNRYHFIKSDDKNEVNISIGQQSGAIVIKITGTGAKFDYNMLENINNKKPVKGKKNYEISSGIELMRDVIDLINQKNRVYIPKPQYIEGTESKYWNTVEVTLYKM